MLRGLLLVLVLANLAFFSWSRGWLAPVWPAPRAGEREPERLTQQVRPQSVTVLTAAEAGAAAAAAAAVPFPASASAADPASAPQVAATNNTNTDTVTAPGNVCLEAGPFTPTEATAAAAALQQVALPAGSWARLDGVAVAQPWLVYAGRFADAAARRTRQQEWARAGLQVQLLDAPADLAPGLVLARYPSREAADAALAALAPSVRQVTRVVQLPATPATSWLRAANADKALAARLTGLPAPWLGSFKACLK